MNREQKIAVAKVAALVVVTVTAQVIVRRKIGSILHDAFVAPVLDATN